MADRPLRADARRNRDRVLAAAQEAFAEHGVGVPLDEIARRAGVGAGTVYRHFPTKEALFEAVVVHQVDELIEEAAGLARSEDPGAAFFDFLGRLAETATTKRDLTDVLAGSGVDLGAAVAERSEAMMKALGRLLRRGQRAGAVRTDIGMPDLTALLKGAIYAVQVGGDNRTRERVFRTITDGLRAG
ncbi:MAG: TetR/AcrR family transcriptional regulator [Streptosporangiales bacterium]|nr:TetR/AcrR family transcriptional regulator [Streptosporangiales bacterium]MBO0890016.1 TetR/AcrR family transcriptional regulator [Acidothermales bacterium]